MWRICMLILTMASWHGDLLFFSLPVIFTKILITTLQLIEITMCAGEFTQEVARPSQFVILLMWLSYMYVQVPLWTLVKFVLGLPEFKSLATPGYLLPVEVFNPVMFYLDYLLLIIYLSGVSINQLDKLRALSTVTVQLYLTF